MVDTSKKKFKKYLPKCLQQSHTDQVVDISTDQVIDISTIQRLLTPIIPIVSMILCRCGGIETA
jgi:hypothetical protein